jgi:hypothetical protein
MERGLRMKSAKKKTQKAAPKKSAPKKKPVAKAAIEECFRVDIECPDHTYRPHVSFACVDETTAREGVAGMQLIGIGGRLIKLDGTPDGALIEKWGGIGDIEHALETESIEKGS